MLDKKTNFLILIFGKIMIMSTLNLPIQTLQWAANNIGLRLDEVISKVSESERTQRKLLEGRFSIKQAEDFSKLTKVPFGSLFLTSPPCETYKPTIPDLRQKQNAEPLSDYFYEVLEDIQKKQEWYADFLKENGSDKLEFVGKFKNTSNLDAEIIANDIRAKLNLPINLETKTSRDNYLKLLINRCEDAGVLVFKNSIVKNATSKPLDTDEFRGFVLIDEYAPAIFLNSRDMPSAIIFTLAHELAHIWLGESGVDDLDIYGNNPIEILCNKIAALVLVSRKEFYTAWSTYNKNITKVATHFYVSRLMIARMALTHGEITKAEYKQLHTLESELFKNLSKDKEEGGPAFINLIPGRNSHRLTHTIVNQALSGNLLLRDAGRLLNVSPKHILKLGGM